MNKTHGATLGAILATGLLMRPGGQTTTPVLDSGHAATTASQGSAKVAREEGPWIASCRYWSAARQLPEFPDAEDTATVNLAVKGEDFGVAGSLSAQLKSSVDDGCEPPAAPKTKGTPSRSDIAKDDMLRWGIPNSSPFGLEPDIHLIIATVQDPVHSHLALAFDRDVDALVQAAGDNHYVPSYYWLPWKRHSAQSRTDESSGSEAGDEDSKREHQPGMIVFKYVSSGKPELQKNSHARNSYSNVIYVFLVGQTPTLGVDGEQLKKAFRYERQLADSAGNYKVSFSMQKADRIDLIGPNSSGSAASMREAIALGRKDIEDHTKKQFGVEVAGTTSTKLAIEVMKQSLGSDPPPTYRSFVDDNAFENGEITRLITNAGYSLREAAILVEDSTTSGAFIADPESGPTISVPEKDDFLVVRFPREISLLRNAHTDDGGSREAQSDIIASPFLHLLLKDPGATDSVPQFSTEHTPLSQEAQLMAIGRQLINNRINFIVIVSSNVLDQLFLAQFLHRACPDARLIFLGADLLFERETENAPFIGTITLTPYNLLGLVSSQGIGEPVRAFADSTTEAFYNASSFILWDGQGQPFLAGYRNPLGPPGLLRASLWATAIGRDGYYPLAIVNDCANMFQIPDCSSEQTRAPGQPPHPPSNSQPGFFGKLSQMVQFSGKHYKGRPYRYPAHSWYVLCIVIAMLCVAHAFAVSFPNYWSSATRDLAIPQGDKRHLRAMYIHIGSVMLFCMAFVTAYPLFPAFRVIHPNWSTVSCSLVTLVAALTALFLTLRKTWCYLQWYDASEHIKEVSSTLKEPISTLGKLRIKFDKNLPWFFNRLAFVALGVIVIAWIYICHTEKVEGFRSHVGFFFSYRCLHPGSGVSPVVPVLLVLLGWYIWAVFQTLRLRFSTKNRPQLPGPIQGTGPLPIYVSDLDLAQRSGNTDHCLFDNITCLLITRNWFNRLIERYDVWVAPWFFLFYLFAYFMVVFVIRVHSLDRILWNPGRLPTWYEWLLSSLFYPLIMIAVAGWLRIVLVWGALKRGLLHRLEQFPIRFAFDRIEGTSWIAMMRQGGLIEQWQDMLRSSESIHQMCSETNLQKVEGPNKDRMRQVKENLDAEIRKLWDELPPGERHSSPSNLYFKDDPSVSPKIYKEYSVFWAKGRIGAPEEMKTGPASGQTGKQTKDQSGLDHMYKIEKYVAAFCEALLGGVLLKHWEKPPAGFAAANDIEELRIEAQPLPEVEASMSSRNPLQLHVSSVGHEDRFIQVAEEFLAIRYLSLIRAVLVNVRYLITFVSAVFVLTIVAWNSYPFQPRQWGNEAFTGLMILLSTGIIWVFAQIHRDPILNRITNTKANELGLDFYLRVTMFGAAPILTWLAYQFPEVWGSILRWIQPSLEVLK